jgi:hypothetical protein
MHINQTSLVIMLVMVQQTAQILLVKAGFGADNGSSSNYLGYHKAGYNASQSYSSNFFGTQAGINTTFANNSNFFGDNAGNNAGANNSNWDYKLVVKQHC